MTTTSLVPPCGPCCGGECICTCCQPYLFPNGTSTGIFTQWALVLSGGSPITLTKVPGQCRWKSADDTVWIFRGGSDLYNIFLYSTGTNPPDGSYTDNAPIEVSDAYLDYHWCRENSGDNAAIVPDGIEDVGPLGSYGYDFSLTPVGGTWLSCDDSTPAPNPNPTEPEDGDWTECD